MSDKQYPKAFIICARIVIIAIIIGVALLISKTLINTKPENPTRPKQERAVNANTIPLMKSDKQIFLNTTGIITYKQKLNIYPQVTGKIVEVSDSFTPGFNMKKDELVVKIDPADYDIAIITAESQVIEAQYNFQVEQGYQSVAKHEWEFFDNKKDLTELEKSLMLRKPHLQKAEAELKSAQAALETAKLNLQRTQIKVPFNSIVISDNVTLGSYVTPQTLIGSVAEADSFRVEATLPIQELKWLKTERDGTPANAYISFSGALSENNTVWEGVVEEVMAELETSGRKAKVQIEIPNPFAQNIPLLLNLFVNVKIDGPILKNVFAVPSSAIRNGDEIWLKNSDKRLEVKKVNIVWRDDDTTIIDGDIRENSNLVISSISSPVSGMKLTTRTEQIKKQQKNDSKAEVNHAEK